jgi:hypothetical protein
LTAALAIDSIPISFVDVLAVESIGRERMVLGNAEIVLFAIQAGVKLYAGVRKAYVDSTRSRALLLPLPRAPGVTATSARNWFRNDGAEYAGRTPRIGWLVARPTLTSAEERELLEIYSALRAEANPLQWEDREPDVVTGEELTSLLTIRQWEESEDGAPRSTLQQVAGTLVNIAVDYFESTPGAVSERRPAGRLLLAFLRKVDDIDFAEAPPKQLFGDILVGLLDGLAANADVVGGGELEQRLVGSITESLARSAKEILGGEAPSVEVDRAGAWLQVIARAIVEGGSKTVLANPVRFLGIDGAGPNAPGKVALIQAIGSTLTELLLAEEHRVTFRALLSSEGVARVAQAALGAVAQNPGLLKVDNQGLKAILVALSDDLSKYDAPFAADLFPELARLVLDRTADHLDLVWGARFKSPERHLLVTASRSLLKALAKKPRSGTSWKPTLTQAQVLGVLEEVFDEVIDNPGWLIERADGVGDALGAAAEAMLAAMAQFDGNRISVEAGLAMFRAGVLAVGARIELLDELPAGGQDAGRVALTALVDIVVGAALGKPEDIRANWRTARNSALTVLLVAALEEVAAHGVGQKELDAVREVMAKVIDGTFSVAEFQTALARRLAA